MFALEATFHSGGAILGKEAIQGCCLSSAQFILHQRMTSFLDTMLFWGTIWLALFLHLQLPTSGFKTAQLQVCLLPFKAYLEIIFGSRTQMLEYGDDDFYHQYIECFNTNLADVTLSHWCL